jgi:hypothetical protein
LKTTGAHGLRKARWKRGFKPLDKINVKHKTKHRERVFSIWLMWMQTNENAKQPKWNREKPLEGVTFCIAHTIPPTDMERKHFRNEIS